MGSGVRPAGGSRIAIFTPRFLRQLRDVIITAPLDGDVPTYDSGTGTWVNEPGGGGGGAPTTADYLVGTAQGGLSAEIVVGATPGGELGGTWASPTVDATHSGSTHAAVQAAAEATAAAALSAHLTDTVDAHDASAISADSTTLVGAGTDVQAVFEELDNAIVAAETATANHLADTSAAHAASAISADSTTLVGTGTDVQAVLEELDNAIVAADPAGSVILAPASSARNVIQPTAGAVIDAIFKAHASQSVDLTEWQLSAGTVVASFGLDGALTIDGSVLGNAVGGDAPRLLLKGQPDPGLNVANILEVRDSGGTDRLHVNTIGQFLFRCGPVADGGTFRVRTQNGSDVLKVSATAADAAGTIAVFGVAEVARQTASDVGALWTALKAYGWLDAASTAPTIYSPGGTDVAVTDGGTGASTTVAARTNLGLVIGTDVAAQVVDAAAGTGSLRTLGTGATQAATGNHVHAASAVTFTPTGTIAATDVQAAIAEVASEASGISPNLFDANTILAADTDNTPAAVTMAASTILARLAAGNIKAASVAEIITLLQAYTVGGTDVAVADGGTGASTAAAARTNLALWPPRILKTGLYYPTSPEVAGDQTHVLTKDQVVFTPFPVTQGFTADRISLGVAVAGTAGAKIRLGIYNDDGSGQPGTLLLDAGTINGDSNTYQDITISQALASGTMYWVAVCWQVQSVGSGTVRGSVPTFSTGYWVGKAANSTDVRTANYKQASVTGAFGSPAVPSTTGAEVGYPNVRIRAA